MTAQRQWLMKEIERVQAEVTDKRRVIQAERVTLEFGSSSTKKLDCGKQSIEDSPLFGGERQKGLFE